MVPCGACLSALPPPGALNDLLPFTTGGHTSSSSGGDKKAPKRPLDVLEPLLLRGAAADSTPPPHPLSPTVRTSLALPVVHAYIQTVSLASMSLDATHPRQKDLQLSSYPQEITAVAWLLSALRGLNNAADCLCGACSSTKTCASYIKFKKSGWSVYLRVLWSVKAAKDKQLPPSFSDRRGPFVTSFKSLLTALALWWQPDQPGGLLSKSTKTCHGCFQDVAKELMIKVLEELQPQSAFGPPPSSARKCSDEELARLVEILEPLRGVLAEVVEAPRLGPETKMALRLVMSGKVGEGSGVGSGDGMEEGDLPLEEAVVQKRRQSTSFAASSSKKPRLSSGGIGN